MANSDNHEMTDVTLNNNKQTRKKRKIYKHIESGFDSKLNDNGPVFKKRKLNEENSNQNKIYNINGTMLKSGKYQNKRVTIIGKQLDFEDKDSRDRQFESTDNVNFTVRLSDNECNYTDLYYEINGYVDDENIIHQVSFQPLGGEFNETLWNDYVYLISKYPNLF